LLFLQHQGAIPFCGVAPFLVFVPKSEQNPSWHLLAELNVVFLLWFEPKVKIAQSRTAIFVPPGELPMNLRIVLWTVAMAYGGFLWAGRGAQSLNSISIAGAVIGAAMGLLLAIMFTRRARRKQI
jgi:membrane associated rhomboid family serine protease